MTPREQENPMAMGKATESPAISIAATKRRLAMLKMTPPRSA
jgi:hypothetical protein